MHQAVPATILAGFLGSGKTTLLNRVLTARASEPIGVIVNEFGAVGIDGRLVVATAEEVVELSNGCLCCEVRADLSGALLRLLDAGPRLGRRRRAATRILIEASGLASPGPIAQTLALDGRINARVTLAGIVTLAHALHVEGQVARHPEAAEQAAYADRLILNHADAPGADLARAEAALRALNATAPIERAVRANCDLARVLAPGAGGSHLGDLAALANVAAVDHTHGVGTVVLKDREPRDFHRLKLWLQFLAARRTHELYRVKGLIACRDHPRSVLVQGTYQVLELGPGPEEVPEESVLVLIGRGLDAEEIRRGWEAVRAE